MHTQHVYVFYAFHGHMYLLATKEAVAGAVATACDHRNALF